MSRKPIIMQEVENGYMISNPGFMNLVDGSYRQSVFYRPSFPYSKLPKTKLAIVQYEFGGATYNPKDNRLFQNSFDEYGKQYILVDIVNNKEEAKQICRQRALDLAKEKAIFGKLKVIENKLK